MHINDLPEEVLIKIFSYLPLCHYIHVREVCSQWKTIADSPYSWTFHPVIYDSGLVTFLQFWQGILAFCGDHISHLIFKRCKFRNIHRVLESVNNLVCLEFIMCVLDDKILDIVPKFHNLKKLSFQNSCTLNPEKLMEFDNMPKLERLFLSNFALGNINFHGLFNCSRISFLMIEKIRGLPENLIVEFIDQNKGILKGLALYGDNLSDNAVKVISVCENLTHLRIIRCDKLTDVSLEYLKALRLKKVLIWNSDIFSPKALMSLFCDPSTRQLTYLSFSKISNITLDVVKVIVQNCDFLLFLSFYRCPQLSEKGSDINDLVKNTTKLFFE